MLMKGILQDSNKFYSKIQKVKESSNLSKHPVVDRDIIIDEFNEMGPDDLVSQRNFCIILRRCSWFIGKLRAEMQFTACHTQGRYLFYKKSKVLKALDHIREKKEKRKENEKHKQNDNLWNNWS